ncbi:hypothetical protein [Crateriforma spongiae]|uniref:hypothetical protein n=1 Tax=Crateriforma spongiae TaxID=2724528 RepID=UPI0039B09418
MRSVLLPGVTVGQGAIIGAGSVVRGHIPDYAVVTGNPGEVVGDSREFLLKQFRRLGRFSEAKTLTAILTQESRTDGPSK